jgi:hypothetical protein
LLAVGRRREELLNNLSLLLNFFTQRALTTIIATNYCLAAALFTNEHQSTRDSDRRGVFSPLCYYFITHTRGGGAGVKTEVSNQTAASMEKRVKRREANK